MKTSAPTWRELLHQLPVDESIHQAVRTHLLHDEEKKGPPWFLALFAGVGAWIAALFVLVFCAFFMGEFLRSGGCVAVGVILFILASLLSRKAKNVFGQQFALACLLSGNALILAGTAIVLDSERMIDVLFVVQNIVALATFFSYRGGLGVFLTLLAVPQSAIAWCLEMQSAHPLHLIVAALAVAVVGLGLWSKRPRALDPAAYAAVVALPISLLTMEMLRGEGWFSFAKTTTPLWPSSIVLAVAVVVWIRHGIAARSCWQETWFRLVVVVLAVLGLFTSPGVLVALLLLIMGRSLGERVLMGLGYVFLLVFLSFHYYALDVSLAHKSWVIGGSGFILLITRWAADQLIHSESKEVGA
jgi:hypothetical protein